MDNIQLKQYIIDNDKIEYILEKLECHDVKSYIKEYRAGIPGHNNKTAIVINKETLGIKIFQSDSHTVRGDIFSLAMTIKNISFPKSIKYLHEILGLKYKYNKNKSKDNEKVDPLEVFKKVKNRKKYFNVNDIEIYNENILDDYMPYPHILWIHEGIMPWTCEEFKIGYSPKHRRIVIPERKWDGNENEFVGIMGRTTIKEFEMLDIPKYYPLIPYPKGLNLYGLQENYKYIQEVNVVNVFESQKSVLKRHSRNDKTGVAVGCHDISDEQVRILISLDVDIIIQMDKGIDINHIRSLCDKFYTIRNIYYVYDKYGLLEDKESPADKSNKIYNYLFKYKIKYDEKERKEYLRWREKQVKN
jgi:DNA primase